MKNLLTAIAFVAAMGLCGTASADNGAMAKMGFGGMKKVSKSAAMKVRGKGAYGVTLTPFIVAKSNEYVNQFANSKAISVKFAAVNSISIQKTQAVQLSVDAATATSSLNAGKNNYTFFGPKLSYGGYTHH